MSQNIYIANKDTNSYKYVNAFGDGVYIVDSPIKNGDSILINDDNGVVTIGGLSLIVDSVTLEGYLSSDFDIQHQKGVIIPNDSNNQINWNKNNNVIIISSIVIILAVAGYFYFKKK